MGDNENKTRTVYVICHNGSEVGKDCYVGNTSQRLKKRLNEHRSDASRPGFEANRFYKRMREIVLKNWVIHPLETATCSEYEIRKLERTWCEILRSDLNSKLPIRWGKKEKRTLRADRRDCEDCQLASQQGFRVRKEYVCGKHCAEHRESTKGTQGSRKAKTK